MIPKKTSLRISLLLFAFFALLLSGCAGGSPFGPQITVPEIAEKAFQEGATKETAARTAETANLKDQAVKLWGETASYYGAVGRKFAGTENGLLALEKQAQVTENGTKNNQAAQIVYRNALKEYPAASFPTLREKVQKEYDDLLAKMDEENGKTAWYKVMAFLVMMLGNNPQVSPIFAILFIAILVTLVLWPLRYKQYQSFKEMQRYQPELNKIREKYKGDLQLQGQKTQDFYKRHGINQFAGCIPALAQWPVTLLMYQVILHYQFHFRHVTFLWVNPTSAQVAQGWPSPLTGAIGRNLSEQDMFLLVIYAISMFVQTKLNPVSPSADPAQVEQQKMMANFMPIIFFVMMLQWQLPSAFVLYWFISNVLGVTQQWIINKRLPAPAPFIVKDDDGGDDDGGTNVTPKPLAPNPKLVSPKNRRPSGAGSGKK